MRESAPDAPPTLSGGAGPFLAFITDQVKPFVDRRFRTLPEESGLFGDSFGGLFALYGHGDLPARVFMSVGLNEEDPGDPASAEAKMVGNVRTLASRLAGRGYPSLELETHLFEGESHISVIPFNFSRGIRAAYPAPDRPRTREGR